VTPNRSLFRHLLAWILGALVVVWAAFMYFGYRTGVHEADELTDGHLASVASILFSQRVSDLGPAPGAATLGGLEELKAHDYQQSLSIVVWDGSGAVLARSGDAPLPRFSDREGFETIELGSPPAAWRAFSRWNGPDHRRKVTVLLSVAERDELAQDIAEQVATPGLWLLPVVAIVLGLALHRGLRPLADLSRQVNLLDVHRETRLQAPTHEEFRAIVNSIDMLMERYSTALARERDLASEVAHELRTPLASLRLHAANLQRNLPAEEARQALERMKVDADRAAAVLTDLLALARASRAELAGKRETTDLAMLVRRVAAEFGQAAMASGHELSVEARESCMVQGHPVLLELALRNLVENALAHTPRGTEVQVRVLEDPITLEVRDNGSSVMAAGLPGPAAAHVGLGLGHQVVRRVAEVHEGHFEQAQREGGGRVYRIVFSSRDPGGNPVV
jgi:two-component system, OmpR family, sensor histidine kinase QseC